MNKREEDNHANYWTGTRNKFIRYYFYCQRGLDLFNNFRYVIMAIFGVYYTLKLKNPAMLLLMAGISIPMLMFIGYYSVHHVGKVIDWLSVKFSTHYGKYTYELMEEQLDNLKAINEKLDKKSG